MAFTAALRSDQSAAPRAGCTRSWRGRKRPAWRVANLAAMSEIMIRRDARHHGLADGHCPDPDAWIVPALGDDIDLVAVAVDGAPRGEDRGCRLDGKPR